MPVQGNRDKYSTCQSSRGKKEKREGKAIAVLLVQTGAATMMKESGV